MRYIVCEPLITVVTDEELTDENTIRDLLINFKENDVRIQLSYEDLESQFIKSLDSVRITAVYDKTIDIHAFLPSATAKYKDIPIINIRKIRLIASKQLLSKKYKVSRFHHMDVAEIDGQI